MAFKMKGSTHYGKNPLKQTKREFPNMDNYVSPKKVEPKEEVYVEPYVKKELTQKGPSSYTPQVEPKKIAEPQRYVEEELIRKGPSSYTQTTKEKALQPVNPALTKQGLSRGKRTKKQKKQDEGTFRGNAPMFIDNTVSKKLTKGYFNKDKEKKDKITKI